MRYVYQLRIDNGDGGILAEKLFSSKKIAEKIAQTRYKGCDYTIDERPVYSSNDFKKKPAI